MFQWGGGNMRPSATHELASGRTRTAHGRQPDVPGMVWSDILEITMRTVSHKIAPDARAVPYKPDLTCNHGSMLSPNPLVPQFVIMSFASWRGILNT